MDKLTKAEKCFYFNTCKNATVTMCGRTEWDEVACQKEIPMTNEEVLQKLSGSTLAEALAEKGFCPYIRCEKTTERKCSYCIAGWLRQPYKECG